MKERKRQFNTGRPNEGRCPTCRQRNSRVREHKMEDGSTTVWFCNVKGCENARNEGMEAGES